MNRKELILLIVVILIYTTLAVFVAPYMPLD